MNRAEILPLAGAHFGARLSGAWGVVVHERNRDEIGLHGQESAEFVQPQIPVHTFVVVDSRGCGKL